MFTRIKLFIKTVKSVLRFVRKHRYLFILMLVMLLSAILADKTDAASMLMAATIVPGVVGGKHVVDGPLTTDLAREASPSLLLDEIDREIVKIRPMATPIDQLSRYGGSKHAGSMVVDYYNVDTKLTTTTLADAYDESDKLTKASLTTANDEIFDASDTILVQGVKGYEDDGVTPSSHELVLYVTQRDDASGLTVMPVNGKTIDGTAGCLPSIPEGAMLIRMGRAASELDVMSPQFEALPQKSSNYCQIFKMQVEQSTLEKLSNKEVAWTMTDQEEAAIYDMRLGMEKSFLFGQRRKLWDNGKKENIMFTGGIWYQAGKEFGYTAAGLDTARVVNMMREAFTGNAGSKRKILLGGSGLIERLNNLDYSRVVTGGQSVTKWGIDFTELRSKFGTLYVLLSEVFDEVGHADDGMVIDPEYLQKYTHLPFTAQQLDLKSSGMRNVDALVLTEASCLVLRYPKAHMRIVLTGKK